MYKLAAGDANQTKILAYQAGEGAVSDYFAVLYPCFLLLVFYVLYQHAHWDVYCYANHMHVYIHNYDFLAPVLYMVIIR